MKRRDFVVAGAAAGALAACSRAPETAQQVAGSAKRFQWKMATSWPADFPGLGTSATRLAERIARASGGRLTITVHGADQLVPAFEVFDAVARGTAEMGHSAAYYWQARHPAAAFFCTVPFGFNAQEMDAWIWHGGGIELWRELYARFNLLPLPVGNTGAQMAGWFTREIRSRNNLKGLKMRIPGLGGAVFARVGGTPVNLPAAEILAALKSGAIDACEWLGPYNDLEFGLFRAARYCYYPGWQEPGAQIEALFNKSAFGALPADLQAVVEGCCRAEHAAMQADYYARNRLALVQLRDDHKVVFKALPKDVLVALRKAADAVLTEIAARDPFSAKVYESFKKFRAEAREWHRVSEAAYDDARA